jgi:hypothetical protein
MTTASPSLRSLLIRQPLATAAAVAAEPPPFPQVTAAMPREYGYDDWRARLERNMSRRSDGRWDPLTYVALHDGNGEGA